MKSIYPSDSVYSSTEIFSLPAPSILKFVTVTDSAEAYLQRLLSSSPSSSRLQQQWFGKVHDTSQQLIDSQTIHKEHTLAV